MSLQKAFEESLGHGHFIERAFLEAVGVHLHEAEAVLAIVRRRHPFLRGLDFLLAMNFMKEYRFELISALQFTIRSMTTYEDLLWRCLEQLDEALPPVRFI